MIVFLCNYNLFVELNMQIMIFVAYYTSNLDTFMHYINFINEINITQFLNNN